jgi:formate dehydrogenase (NADP+) alpha subunit
MVTLTIDGRETEVSEGVTILEAAAGMGIRIPTLCWLEKVSTTGACRICVVAVEGVDRPMTACNTPVKAGITVTTSTPELELIRRKTLELMLVNHPLDCPVCDAAGECDLQDTCVELQVSKNRYGAELERLPIRYDWPLIESDPNRCILCEKCVKVCHEVVGADAIQVTERGDRTIVDTVDGAALDCDFCGNCVNSCPTGTLISKPFKFCGRPWTFTVTPGVCGFCSSGCQIEYHARDGKVQRVTSSDTGYNRGNLCINGRFGYAAFNAPDRLSTPLVQGTDGTLQASSWDQALTIVADQLKQIISTSGGSAVAGIGSPRITNEENYLFQKFLRGALGSNNIDSEARLGYFPAQLIQCSQLGYSGATLAMDSIEQATAVVVIGADLKAESAGYAYRVIQAVTRNNAKLVLASSRATSMNTFANTFLQYRPGSEAWLAAGLCKALLAEGIENTDFITQNTTGLEALLTSLEPCSFEQISAQTGIGEAELREAARLIANGGRTAVIYGAELMRSVDSAAAVGGVVDLALLTGAVGSNGAGIFPLDEKNNTQGMLDMGACPEFLPGYQTYEHAAALFGSAWNSTLPLTPGKNLFQIIDAIEKGEIRALYVIGSDLLRILPDRDRVRQALQKLELLVVQDLFPTETARLAHVVLPAATAAEKSGSFTTVDNRVQSFGRAVAPAAQARSDAEILSTLHRMIAPAAKINGNAPENIHEEITALSGLYSASGDQSAGQMIRAANRVLFTDKPAVFIPLAPAYLAAGDQSRPFMLSVGPLLHHNGTYTTWSTNNLSVSGAGYVAIHPDGAVKAGIVAGDSVRLSSEASSVVLTARLSDVQQTGLLFAPTHFRDSVMSLLTRDSGACVAVRLEKA